MLGPDLWSFRALSYRVYDGDTIMDLVLDLGFGVRTEIKGRLIGINAPEVRGSTKKKGIESRDWLKREMDRAQQGETLRIVTEKQQGVGKYGRWLVTVYDADCNLNEEMIRLGLAKAASY